MLKVLIYANCQGSGIEKFIFPEISKHMDVSISHEVNYAAITGGYGESNVSNLPEDFMSKIQEADVFIYQPIAEKHGVLSTNKLVKYSITNFLPENCLSISFPYAYNNALWPVFSEGKSIKIDSLLLKAAKNSSSEKELISLYNSGNIRFEFYDRFETTSQILEEKESYCDVKISKYIRANVNKKRLFLTQNHPATDLFIEMSRQVIKIVSKNLGFNFDEQNYVSENTGLNANVVGIPGYYPIDIYSLRHYNFHFMRDPDEFASHYYEAYLCAVYNLIKGNPAGIPAIPNYQGS